jgi:hypothetical protein
MSLRSNAAWRLRVPFRLEFTVTTGRRAIR